MFHTHILGLNTGQGETATLPGVTYGTNWTHLNMGDHQDIYNHTSYKKRKTYFPEITFTNKTNGPA